MCESVAPSERNAVTDSYCTIVAYTQFIFAMQLKQLPTRVLGPYCDCDMQAEVSQRLFAVPFQPMSSRKRGIVCCQRTTVSSDCS